MLGRFFVLLIFILNSTALLHAEIIKITLLKSGKKDFLIKRDIFSPVKLRPGAAPREMEPIPEVPEEPVNDEEQKDDSPGDMEAEIRQSISFEGYVIKNTRNHALLSINGEFFIAAKDDIVLEKIKIVKIEKEELTVEVDAKIYKIKLKGDEEDELQK